MNESIKRSFFRHTGALSTSSAFMHASARVLKKLVIYWLGGRAARSVRANYVKGLD